MGRPAGFKDQEEIDVPPMIAVFEKILQPSYDYPIMIHSFPYLYSIKNNKMIKQGFWLAQSEVGCCFCQSEYNPSPQQKYLTCLLPGGLLRDKRVDYGNTDSSWHIL